MSRKTRDPFVQMIYHATDRLYSPTTDITIDLDNDPIGTLQRLITAPNSFGTLRPRPEAQRIAYLNELVTLARAYIDHKRKPKSHDASQPQLPLPKP